MSLQKCLILDIETWPILAAVFDLKDQNIGLNQIRKDTSVMAWGAKWLGDKEVMYMDTRTQKDIRDDKSILIPMWRLLNEAEIVITQNGQSFDGPRLTARFMAHKMTPPSPYKHLDTYRIVKRVAKFTSNKLEYLTDKLNVKYKKLTHSKFPGMSLWNECEKGNKEAWDEMKTYNIHDVLSTEELYMNLRAWIPESMPAVHVIHNPSAACRVCGDRRMQKRGLAVKKHLKYQRYQCSGCGAWTTDSKAIEQSKLKKAS